MEQINSNDNFVLGQVFIDRTTYMLPFIRSFEDSAFFTYNNFIDSTFPQKSSDLKLLCLNCRSLSKSFIELKLFLNLSQISFDIIALSETWLNEEKDSFFNLQNYNFYNSNRTVTKGGGVAFYININKLVIERPDLKYQNDICEIIAIEIISNLTKNTIILNIYKPPSSSPVDFFEILDSIFYKISSENKFIYCVGDFNIDVNKNTNTSNRLLSLMSSFFMFPTNSFPTRTTENTSSNIDLIFTNNITHFTGGVIQTDISDHNSIFIIQSIFPTKNNLHATTATNFFQNTSIKNLNKFKTDLYKQNWENIIDSKSCNEAFNIFFSQFRKIFVANCPFNNKKKKEQFKFSNPWFNVNLKTLIKKKNKLFRKYKKSNNPNDHAVYKNFRNNLNKIINATKRRFYHTSFQNNINNSKETWKQINSLINTKKNIHNIILKSKDTIITDPIEVCKTFNNHFVDLFPYNDQIDLQFLKYIKPKYIPSFNPSPTSPFEIISIVDKLSNSSSKDAHYLNNKILKFIIDPLANILTQIFNLSLEQGLFPDALKITKVFPILKSGSSSDLTNYRPISVVSSISKILEKIMVNRLNVFLEQNKILNREQFGFRKNCSTESAILNFLDDIYNSINKDLFSMAVFIDFSKAFDSINHRILLMKLEAYGVRGRSLNWFSSYLSARQQFVSIGSASSTLQSINNGVPQGSILGPILFNIYLNDIIHASSIPRYVIYADDTTVYYHSSDITLLFRNMNNALAEINDWANVNKLTINLKKTQYMLFNTKNHSLQNILRIGETLLERVNHFKLLGVIIDQKLNFWNHIEHISRKVNQSLGIINRIKFFIQKATLVTLYYSLIFPHLYYGNLVWGATFKSHLNKLYSLQKKFFHITKNYLNQTYRHDVSIFFNQYNILTIFELNIYKSSIFYFKIITTNSTQYNITLIHNNSTRSKNKLLLNHNVIPKKSLVTRNLFYYGINNWNALPLYVKSSTCFSQFKQHLKNFLNCLS